MSDDTLILEVKKYDKLGIVHCGVTYEGFIAVGGDVADIEDGQEITFDRTGIKASRKGSEYTFSKTG